MGDGKVSGMGRPMICSMENGYFFGPDTIQNRGSIICGAIIDDYYLQKGVGLVQYRLEHFRDIFPMVEAGHYHGHPDRGIIMNRIHVAVTSGGDVFEIAGPVWFGDPGGKIFRSTDGPT